MLTKLNDFYVRFCDFINIAAYDYHFAYESVVNHHAALYPLPEEVEDHPNAELNVVS